MSTMSCLLGALLAFFVCGTCVLSQVYDNPGLRIKTTEKALDTIGDLFMENVFVAGGQMPMPMPDETGSTKIVIGTVDYKLTNIKAVNFKKPAYNVAIKPGSLNLILSNTGFTVLGNWSYKHRLFGFSDSGTINVTVAVPLINLSLAVALDRYTSRPVLSVSNCNSNVSSAAIQLSGGASWLYNLFTGAFRKSLEGTVQSKICTSARNFIEVEANGIVAQHPLQQEIGDDFSIDLRPLSTPVFGNGFVECLHNGTVYDERNPTKPPMQALSFPSSDGSSQSPVSIWVSEYVPNAMLYALFKRGILKHSLTQSTLPESMKEFLNTTCSKETVCAGKIVPQLSTKFPNSFVEVEIIVTNPPVVSISYNGVQGSVLANLTVRARLSDGSLAPAFTARINGTSFTSLSIVNSRLMVNVTRLLPDATLVGNSTIGTIPNNVLSDTLESLVKQYLLPRLRDETKDGFPIPVPECIQLKNAALSMLSNCLLLTTDIAPSP